MSLSPKPLLFQPLLFPSLSFCLCLSLSCSSSFSFLSNPPSLRVSTSLCTSLHPSPSLSPAPTPPRAPGSPAPLTRAEQSEPGQRAEQRAHGAGERGVCPGIAPGGRGGNERGPSQDSWAAPGFLVAGSPPLPEAPQPPAARTQLGTPKAYPAPLCQPGTGGRLEPRAHCGARGDAVQGGRSGTLGSRLSSGSSALLPSSRLPQDCTASESRSQAWKLFSVYPRARNGCVALRLSVCFHRNSLPWERSDLPTHTIPTRLL